MTKLMKIKSTIQADGNGCYKVTSQHYDKTPFSIDAKSHQVQLNEPIVEEGQAVSGFLFVEQIGEQSDKCFIVLPNPSIPYGRNVTVSKYDLSPMNVSIADFTGK